MFSGDSAVSASVGVASVEVRRRIDESIDSAAVVAATTLGRAVDELLSPEQTTLWLVALGRPTPRSNRIAAYKAERDGLWTALEKSGVELPDGSRAESSIARSDDVLWFGGAIEVTAAELPVALEVTRRENAVCIGNSEVVGGVVWQGLLAGCDPLPENSVGLLRVVLHEISGGLFAARSFGQFDDPVVISEVFAEDKVLNRLASALERAV